MRYKRSPLFDEKEKTTIYVMYADRVTRAATMILAAELEELREFYTDACGVHGEFQQPLP
jgi:hypothetical protein